MSEDTEKAGTLYVEINADTASLKRLLKNLLVAVEASEKGVDVVPKDSINDHPDYVPRDNFQVDTHQGERVELRRPAEQAKG